MKDEHVTLRALRRKKRNRQKITMLTAYDATIARLLDQSGIDILLVGDSLGMVFQGNKTTLGVTLDQVVYHTRAVTAGSTRAHIVADLPFMSYQVSLEDGLRSAGRLISEGGAHAVKLEGGAREAALVKRLTEIGIPVMGHVGLTPQSVHQMGGYRVQGKNPASAERVLRDADSLQEAGAYAVVLEALPADVARTISAHLSIPTIGIGAGPHCDGQVLVINDLIGLDDRFSAKFVRVYDALGPRIIAAARAFIRDTHEGTFPAAEETWSSEGSAAKPADATS